MRQVRDMLCFNFASALYGMYYFILRTIVLVKTHKDDVIV